MLVLIPYTADKSHASNYSKQNRKVRDSLQTKIMPELVANSILTEANFEEIWVKLGRKGLEMP